MSKSKIPSSTITDVLDIKLLLCYIFAGVSGFIKKDILVYALQEYNFVNYFDFNNAFSELLKDNSIVEDKNNKGFYSITPKGSIIAKELKKNLPLTVREKALEATVNLLAKLKREKENSANIKKLEDGYYVSGNISGDNIANLMNFSLYVPNEDQAKLIKKNFQSYPEKVYECMLAILTGNKDIINTVLREISKN